MAGTISWIPNLTTAGNITTTAGNVIGGGRVRKVEYYSNQSVNISRNSHIVFMNVTTVTGGGGDLLLISLPISRRQHRQQQIYPWLTAKSILLYV